MVPEPSSASNRQPAVLGRYELLAHLASGGMAEVWLARLTGAKGFGRFFALKRMHRSLASQDKFVRMFLDEAEVASHVQHPNVVPIFELGEEDGELFLVMELVVGVSLSTLLGRAADRGETLAVPAVLQIVSDTALGLHAAHTAVAPDGQPLGIVHRDVSPQNVLVGADGRARVVDFGIAKALMRTTETQTGELKGKLSYYSPEQALAKPVDARSDVFSLGIVLWESLVGQRLFRSDSPLDTLRRITQDPVRDPRELAAVPRAIARVTMHALERDLGRRIPSAAAFEAELREAALASGIVPSAEAVASTVEREAHDKISALRSLVSRRWTQRHAIVASQAVVLGESSGDSASGVRVSDTLVTPPTVSLPETPAPPAVDPAPRRRAAPLVVAVMVGLAAAVGGGLLAWLATGGATGSDLPLGPPLPARPTSVAPGAALPSPVGAGATAPRAPASTIAPTAVEPVPLTGAAEPARRGDPEPRTGRAARGSRGPSPALSRPPPLLGPAPAPRPLVTPVITPAPRPERPPLVPVERPVTRPAPPSAPAMPTRGVIRDYDP